ncbi:MAG: hypothetical protein VX834_07835 [Myxococcota bacterium]|nr:hypothetical protein [Myxococcota bacterium]
MNVKTASYQTEVSRESGYKHLTEAMMINIKRGVEYSRKTQGRSLMVTVPLVIAEFMTLFVAIIFDLWGMFYNARGINIVSGDYVPMAQAKAIDAPLRHRKVAPAHVHEELRKTIKNYQSECLAAISAGRYWRLSELTYEMIGIVFALEAEYNCLFPMHRHLLESIGFAALNGLDYARQSRGKTMTLTKWFLLVQVGGLSSLKYFDEQAQPCHAMGAGILENDVPHIPFVQRHQRSDAKRRRLIHA